MKRFIVGMVLGLLIGTVGMALGSDDLVSVVMDLVRRVEALEGVIHADERVIVARGIVFVEDGHTQAALGAGPLGPTLFMWDNEGTARLRIAVFDDGPSIQIGSDTGHVLTSLYTKHGELGERPVLEMFDDFGHKRVMLEASRLEGSLRVQGVGSNEFRPPRNF